MTDRRFRIAAAAASGMPTYSLAELDQMADELLATAVEFDAPKAVSREPDYDRIMAAWNGRKPREL